MPCSFRLLVIILLSLAVLSGSMLSAAYAETQPTVQVTSVDYPQTVPPGTQFKVEVNAWYSGSFLSDVGIWDLGSGLMVQSMTFISQFLGPGNVSFTLNLTAPRSQGPWHLLAINRIWWQNAWYQDPKGGEQQFTVAVSNNIALTLGSLGTSAQISVDGHEYGIQNGSYVTASVTLGAHVLSAPTVIQPTAGQRYVFTGWSDGVNSNPHTIFLTEPTTLCALYRTEFYLSVQSDMGQVTGEGWYPNGAGAQVAITPTAVTNDFGYADEFQFTGWSGASNSGSSILVLTMDGPKQVEANWANVGPIIDSSVISDLLLLCCLPLLCRLVFLQLKRRRKTSQTGHVGFEKRWLSLSLLLVLLVLPLIVPMVHAQSLPQPNATTVKIGDAEWYYWGRPATDTCLIWLGGGVPEQTEPGSYGYFINPFDYESFDTIRFIQDLTNYYCVMALEQGSVQGFNPTANRTIYQEFFQPQSTTIEDVHSWIIAQGYLHSFVVGYSVGGQAAVADLTLSHPEDWTTGDGLILITVPFDQDVLSNAKELQANLFIIYGGNLPDYEATGMQFYNATQTEGVRGTGYFHKEFHVIEDAGHEVWTLRATGAYDRQALNLIIGFIERSKTLQVTHGLLSLHGNSTNSASASVLSVQAPSKVNTGEAFLMQCNVSLNASNPSSMILAAYTQGASEMLSEVSLAGRNGTRASLVIPSISNSMSLVISLVVLQNSNGGWVQASRTYSTTIPITDLITLTVQTSSPGSGFSFDGTNYSTNSSGLAEIQTVPGQHLVEAQPFIYVSNVSRLRFVAWEDLTNVTSRQISLSGDRTIHLSYVQQYLVQVNSTYGETNGSGWYDANSTASAIVQPPMLNSPPVIFSNWAPYANQSQVRLLFPVTSPQVVSAVWDNVNQAPQPAQIFLDPTLILSILAFLVLVVLNLKLSPSRQISDPDEE